jgi:heme-degrading monooxygenase HmoA
VFSVIFEVCPKTEAWDAYLGEAKMLRPELERMPGFVDNIRYKSLTRDGWILSLSGWRDEKSVVRWRTHSRHHEVQGQGRSEILADYHLRVGEITEDTVLPPGCVLREQRLDETETGEGTAITLITATRDPDRIAATSPEAIAEELGFDPYSSGDCIACDVFDAVLTPGDLILLTSWRSQAAAEAFGTLSPMPDDARFRRVRVVRDYGMFDRREAPQYYPDADGRETIHT